MVLNDGTLRLRVADGDSGKSLGAGSGEEDCVVRLKPTRGFALLVRLRAFALQHQTPASAIYSQVVYSNHRLQSMLSPRAVAVC